MRISRIGGSRGKRRLWYIWCGSSLGHDRLRPTNRINLLPPVEAIVPRSNNTGRVARGLKGGRIGKVGLRGTIVFNLVHCVVIFIN